MKNTKSPLSIRIIYWFTIAIQYLLGMVVIGAIAFNVFIYLEISDNLQIHTQFPAKVDFLEVGNLDINDQNVKIELVEATTKIHFIDTPIFIAKKAAIAMLIATSGFLYLIIVFKKFITNVKNGQTFNIENIKLLKKLSYGIVGFWLFTMIYMKLFYHYIGTRVEFEHIRISSDTNDYSVLLFIALLIWVLAHIFIKGLELQNDKDLTI
ncbi:MAG: DUF2975 domain-containing protein [Bacteroidales bacterium]|nr:DUF2975 domain-containing protein [Bacteroidales bacterium]